MRHIFPTSLYSGSFLGHVVGTDDDATIENRNETMYSRIFIPSLICDDCIGAYDCIL